MLGNHIMPTVFVVDSESMGGAGLLERVQDAGFHTLPMSNADMALAVLKAIRADLLLVDVSHAETGGPRLIDEVRRNRLLRETPILAVGAQPDGEDFRRLERTLGIGHVLVGDEYSRAELLREIRKYLAAPVDTYFDNAIFHYNN
jgi:CheY-like chemotaxis protein